MGLRSEYTKVYVNPGLPYPYEPEKTERVNPKCHVRFQFHRPLKPPASAWSPGGQLPPADFQASQCTSQCPTIPAAHPIFLAGPNLEAHRIANFPSQTLASRNRRPAPSLPCGKRDNAHPRYRPTRKFSFPPVPLPSGISASFLYPNHCHAGSNIQASLCLNPPGRTRSRTSSPRLISQHG